MRRTTLVPLLVLALAGSARAGGDAPGEEDPYLWLEQVRGDRALDWVKRQSARTDRELSRAPGFKRLERRFRAILDSDEKIPYVQKLGPYYYNFWKDAKHERGIWRRTTLEEYRKPKPRWETVIDLDALSKKEKEKWVWHGANCLKPAYERCLVDLSRGGSDADVTREFDLTKKAWVKGGFHRPEAKGYLGWIDQDTVYVGTDFGEGSMTASGYPRIVKEWKRGTPLASARTLFSGEASDVSVGAYHDFTPGFERDLVYRSITFYSDELFLRAPEGGLTKLDLPASSIKDVHRDWIVLELRDPWEVGGARHVAGSLLAARFDDVLAGKPGFTVLFTPDERSSLGSWGFTKSALVVNLLEDVKSRVIVLRPEAGGWKRSDFPGAPEMSTLTAYAVDADEGDDVWLGATGFLSPSTLSLATLGQPPELLKTSPAWFDATPYTVDQHFVASKDGTRVPYFVVRRKDLPLDGAAPTLLYGYGGFEIALRPFYSGTVGAGWLERGGVYVVANIRGGGEYGPRWHQAALKQNRPRAYEDFAAVARDLVARKITTPARLGAMGGSNGGLLVGNMLVGYPELFGAIVVQVPLLDMKRYRELLAGASWMAEYGDPSKPEEWAFIKTFSPYQLFDAKRDYPPVFFVTSTKDDRVHPGHARKMAARMLDAGKDVRYFENVEGGHAAAATHAQKAHMDALAYTFLWQTLSGEKLAARPPAR